MHQGTIGSSELIFNKDGSIYHLALKPGDLAETIFLVGDPGRVEKVSRHFDRVELRVEKREFITHTGSIGNQRFSVVSTGIGTDNIDIVINECDALFNIDFSERRIREERTRLRFIRLGTSGAISRDLLVGDILSSEYAIGLDGLQFFYPAPESGDVFDLHKAIRDHEVHLLLPERFYVVKTDPALSQMIGKGMKKGITMTSPGFYGPQGRALRIPSKMLGFPEASQSFRWNGLALTNFEMETSALFLLSRLLGHAAASVNAIIAQRSTVAFSEKPASVVDKMIVQVLESFST